MEAKKQRVEALLQYFNQPSLSPKMIDEEFDQQGQYIGVKIAKNIINTRDQLKNQNGVGFTSLEEIDQVTGVGPAKFRLILEHFDLGDSPTSDPQNQENSTCLSPQDVREEIRKALNTNLSIAQEHGIIGSGPEFGELPYTHQANLIGMSPPILANAKTEAAKLVIDLILEKLKEKGADDGKTTAESNVSFQCETKISATADGVGFNKEKFWWNVTDDERKKYDPVQKQAAKKAADAALEVRLTMLKAFSCDAPCKKFFDVTYGEPVYSEFLWKGSWSTFVTWKCVVSATVKYGCRK